MSYVKHLAQCQVKMLQTEKLHAGQLTAVREQAQRYCAEARTKEVNEATLMRAAQQKAQQIAEAALQIRSLSSDRFKQKQQQHTLLQQQLYDAQRRAQQRSQQDQVLVTELRTKLEQMSARWETNVASFDDEWARLEQKCEVMQE